MSNILRRKRTKDWARLAMRAGLLLTDAKLWSAIQNQMHDRVDDISDALNEKYEDASDRLSNASDALRGGSQWPSWGTFLVGVGIGTGIGLLVAPTSRDRVRRAFNERAAA
jgi:gas vesicle protein